MGNHSRGELSIAFGGFKQSGIGREGGTEGLMPFLETKVMILDDEPSHLATVPTNPDGAGPREL